MRILSSFVLLAAAFIFLTPLKSVLAEDLLIIGVQIAGEKTNNDFIKIYNLSNQNLDISDYKLRKRASTGGESSIRVFPQGSKIPAKEYFLWTNSKDDYHLKSGANVWSATTLAKNNSIALLNPENRILDALAWGESQNPFVEGSPFLENPAVNQKLERKQINGTYQDTNNNANDFYLDPISKPENEKELVLQPKVNQELTEVRPPLVYPDGVVINEILPNTALDVRDEEGEYIEIFNQNSFEVEIADWKIEDTAGSKGTYTFPQGTEIKAQGFLVLYRPTIKITLNNDADGLNLFQPNGKIVDSVNYEKALRGQSYNRTPAGWLWSSTLTPGRENIIATQETKTEPKDTSVEVKPQPQPQQPQQIIDINIASVEELQKITGIGPVLAQRIIDARPFYSLEEITKVNGIGPKALKEIKKQGLAWVNPELKPPKIEKTESSEKELAAISEPLQQIQSKQIPKSLSIFLIALSVAIFSGVIILILKNKLKKNHESVE